jgi:hypothetical protein
MEERSNVSRNGQRLGPEEPLRDDDAESVPNNCCLAGTICFVSSPYLSPLFCQSGLNRPGRKSAVLIQWRHQSLHQVPEPRRFHDVSGLCP